MTWEIVVPDWKRNRLTERLNLNVPIIQAPMAGASTPAMATAVSRGGGLGSLGAGKQPSDKTRVDCQTIRAETNGAYNVNFFAHEEPEVDLARSESMREQIKPYFEEFGLEDVPRAEATYEPFNEDHLAAVLEMMPPVVSFHYGLPRADLFKAVKGAGLFTISSATNLREAKELEVGGIDAIIAQGYEAGGHRGTFAEPYEDGYLGTMALVPQIVDAVSVPVIAAGGIMDGRGIAAALALGAEAVQMGTAFLCTSESMIAEVYRDILLESDANETRLTHAFSGRPARGIENRYIREMRGNEDKLPSFPIPDTLLRPLQIASAEAGSGDFVSLWAGQGLGMSRTMAAGELLDKLTEETDEVLGRLG
tara:strand:- start:82 stop:1176 length:1095 start_codon:yes stop_codon:yes gene_type:complete